MASHLDESLQQVSAAIQQIAISAGNVNENQLQLGAAVTEIGQVTKSIYVVLDLIKNISDQTKMLGLVCTKLARIFIFCAYPDQH